MTNKDPLELAREAFPHAKIDEPALEYRERVLDWFEDNCNLIEDALETLTALKTYDPKKQVVIDGWQPIEAAPKDPTPCLIFCEKGPVKRIDVAQYSSLGGWYTRNLTYYGCDVVKYWMPLPEPPADAQKVGEDG